jgi:hypothetical protein
VKNCRKASHPFFGAKARLNSKVKECLYAKLAEIFAFFGCTQTSLAASPTMNGYSQSHHTDCL